jgi:hypothetical protein
MFSTMFIRAVIVSGLLGAVVPLPGLATAEAAPRAKTKSQWITSRPSAPNAKWLPPSPCRKAACRR